MNSESTELAVVEERPTEIVEALKTPRDYRTESVAHALDAAYSNASKLVLTPEEAKALSADFPDEAFRLGAGGDPNLIYIEHAYLRQRLNEVLGVGASVPIRRREWTEEFSYYKDGKQKIGVRIYVDLVLIVRGCVVGEAIGDSMYYPANSKTNYSDALESAKSNAFRRCCKEFGIGLQAWMKGWGEGWKERNRSGRPRPAPKAADKPTVANFAPPAGWPDSNVETLNRWIGSLSSSAHFTAALGLFQSEPTLVNMPVDWEPVLHHLAETYKAKYQTVGTAELNQSIKNALDKLELDKQAEEPLDRGAQEAIA